MPPTPVPPEIEAFLREPNPAVVATLRADGSPHSVATWYDWVDGLILLNMDATRARLGHLRRDPRVSLTVLDKDRLVQPRLPRRRRRAHRRRPRPRRHRPARAPLPGTPVPEPSRQASQRLGAPRALAPLGLKTHWRPVTPSRSGPAGDEPAAAWKRQHIRPRRTQIRTNRAAQTPTIPQSNSSAASETTARGRECAHHRPHQEAAVAGADQDPVEREDGPVQRLHQHEQGPDRLHPLDHRLVARERVRQDALEREHHRRRRRSPRRPRARSCGRSRRRPARCRRRRGRGRRSPGRRSRSRRARTRGRSRAGRRSGARRARRRRTARSRRPRA